MTWEIFVDFKACIGLECDGLSEYHVNENIKGNVKTWFQFFCKFNENIYLHSYVFSTVNAVALLAQLHQKFSEISKKTKCINEYTIYK